MRTKLQGSKFGIAKALAIASSLCAAALVAAPAGAREGTHGAAHFSHEGVRGGASHGGAAWHGGAAGVHAAWHGGAAGHGGGAWRGGGGGHWAHGWHGGHYGWWWFGAGVWWPYYAWGGYPYYPYYPYYGYPGPNYDEPLVEPPASYGNMPAPQQFWYYCDAANGYYPTVPSCPGGWRPVPPNQPPGAAAPPPPSAPQ